MIKLYYTCRENRQGIDLVKDEVEHSLDREVENIRNYQERMRETLDIAGSQQDQNMRRQVQLQEDLDNKDLALDIDKICYQLRNNSANIALQAGVENIDASGEGSVLKTEKSHKAPVLHLPK